MKTIVCGVDVSPGGRAALRVAALLVEKLGARLYDEAPDAYAESRGEVGDVAERLAAVARAEGALMIVLGARSRGRSRAFLRARCPAELAQITDVPVLVAPRQLAAEPTLPQLSTPGGFS
jgi:nucleotide-binding universal stress UspA family protein